MLKDLLPAAVAASEGAERIEIFCLYILGP